MDANSKIWLNARTGFKMHAFLEGAALCNKVTTVRTGVLGQSFNQTLESDRCQSCERRYRNQVAYDESLRVSLERDHAEALTMNAEREAEQTDVYACCKHAPMYHGARGCDECDCGVPRTQIQEENDMPSLDKRVTTGPLTPRQGRILADVAEGREHAEIAHELSLSRTAVSEDVRVIVAKMKVRNTAQAICSYGQYLAYMDAAQALSDGLVQDPIDPAEVHVNHVLEDLAQLLRTTAERMLPQ